MTSDKKTVESVLSWAFADLSNPLADSWYRFRSGEIGFNQNRARTVVKSEIMTVDESMIAWEPQTTKTGGLPNLSFIKRKPKPLGTDSKMSLMADTVSFCGWKFRKGKPE